jgi:hypothetical protein
MANIKYVIIPETLMVTYKSAFIIKFHLPNDESKYFVTARTNCKKLNKNEYLAKLDLDKVDNHKVYDATTKEELAVISDVNLFDLFNEYFDENIINEKFPSKDKTSDNSAQEISILKKRNRNSKTSSIDYWG